MRRLLRTAQLSQVASVLVVAALGWSMIAASVGAQEPLAKLELGPETTIFTEPLDAAGNVDYLAALNEILSAGVTPENNFDAGFWAVAPPSQAPKNYRAEFFRRLGISPLQAEGEYVRLTYDYRKKFPEPPSGMLDFEEENAADLTSKKRWSAQSHPWLVPWMKASERPLDRIVEASKRARSFSPLMADATLPGLYGAYTYDGCFYLTLRVLHQRVLFRAGSGRMDDALDDLEALYRIARLLEQSPLDLDVRRGTGFRTTCAITSLGLLESPELTLEHVRRLRSMRAVVPSKQTKLYGHTRLSALDLAQQIRVQGVKPWLFNEDFKPDVAGVKLPNDGFSADDPRPPLDPILRPLEVMLKTKVDWNDALRQLNRYFDRYEAVPMLPYSKRKAGLTALAAPPQTSLSTVLRADKLSRAEATRLLVDIILWKLNPSGGLGEQFATTHVIFLRIADVAIDLAEYRLRHGRYPEKLEQLAGIAGAAPHDDPFVEGKLRYRREADGYILYGVGENGVDDGGGTVVDSDQPKDTDDVAIRIPIPVEKK